MNPQLKQLLRVLPWYGFAVTFMYAFWSRDPYGMAFSGTWLVILTILGHRNWMTQTYPHRKD